MNRVVAILVLLAVHAPVSAQDRVRVVQNFSVQETPAPTRLEELLAHSDIALLVRIQESKSKLNSMGEVARVHLAEVLSQVAGALDVEAGSVIEVEQSGGAVFTGAEIRLGDSSLYTELSPGERYLLFLRKYEKPEYSLLWGKYAAFQILGDRVLPCAESSHSYFGRYAGMRVEDFCGRALAISERMLRGEPGPARARIPR